MSYKYHKCTRCGSKFFGGMDHLTPCPYCVISRLTSELAEKTVECERMFQTREDWHLIANGYRGDKERLEVELAEKEGK